MRRHHVLAAATASLALAPSAAHAAAPSPKLEKQYSSAYERAQRQDADPGRNILADGIAKPGRDRPARAHELRRSLVVLRRMAPPAVQGGGGSTASPALEAIAQCESGGNPAAVSADGSYRGKYQFDYGTWQSVGGSGDPAAAPEAEQDRRAAILMARSGSSPWPTCGG